MYKQVYTRKQKFTLILVRGSKGGWLRVLPAPKTCINSRSGNCRLPAVAQSSPLEGVDSNPDSGVIAELRGRTLAGGPKARTQLNHTAPTLIRP